MSLKNIYRYILNINKKIYLYFFKIANKVIFLKKISFLDTLLVENQIVNTSENWSFLPFRLDIFKKVPAY